MSRGRVVLAMSGGVDSSVAAHLLAEDGYDVVGLFMRTGAYDESAAPAARSRGCCSAVDAADARQVADDLDIPFHALNFSEDFGRIKDYFVDEYLAGRTPNPCVVCNTWLKFGKLWEYAKAIDADWIATGHYARIVRDAAGVPELHAAIDATKDQSYFLFGMDRDILGRVLFPVGAMHKSDVRREAEKRGLGVCGKPDSQEICFVPSGKYQEFIASHRPGAARAPGDIVDVDGRKVAEHAGVSGFTIGQRKGLGLAAGEPRYVVALRPESQQVVIGPRELLSKTELRAERVNWLVSSIPGSKLRCQVKIRYLHRPAWATLECRQGDEVVAHFDEPQSAITPGQAAVFYQGTQVLGGGWIRE